MSNGIITASTTKQILFKISKGIEIKKIDF